MVATRFGAVPVVATRYSGVPVALASKSMLNGKSRFTSAAFALETGSSLLQPITLQKNKLAAEGATAPKRIRPLVLKTNCVNAVPLKLKVNPMGCAAELASSVLAVTMAVPVVPKSAYVPAVLVALAVP